MKSRSLSSSTSSTTSSRSLKRGSIISAMMLLLFIGGALYYVATQAIENQKNARHERVMADANVVTNMVFTELADPFKCTETFRTSFSPSDIVTDLEMTPTGPAAGSVVRSLNAGAASRQYGNENIKIDDYQIRDSTPYPQLHITLIRPTAEEGERGTYSRKINLYMEWEDAPFASTMTKCQAITDMDMIWSMSTGNAIYYYGDATGNGRAGVMRGEPPMPPLSNTFEVEGNVLVSWPESTEHATQTARVTATRFKYESDQNLKENIQTIANALELVKKLRGVSFEWKRNQREDFGFVAQELQKVFPDLVSSQYESGHLAVDYGKLTGVLLEAVKEQNAQLEALRAEIRSLTLETSNTQ